MPPIDFILDIPAYLPAVESLREKYTDSIRVLTGMEPGLQCRVRDYRVKLVAELDADDLIGSSHFIDGFDVYDRRCYEGKYLIDEILRTVIEKGKGIECNTAGFKYGLGHPHPYEEIYFLTFFMASPTSS